MIEITFTVQDPRIYETSGPPQIGTLICRKSKFTNHYNFEQSWPYEFAHIVEETPDKYIIKTLCGNSTHKVHKHVIGRKNTWSFVHQKVIDDMTNFFNCHITTILFLQGFKVVNTQEQS